MTTARDQIALVARREFRTLVVSRSFLVGAAVTVLLVIGGFAVTVAFPSDPLRIGVTGPQPPGAVATLQAMAEGAGEEVEVITIDDGTAPAEALETMGLRAVVVDGDRIVVAERDDGVVSRISAAWSEARLVDRLADAGVDDGVVAGALQPLAVTELDPDSTRDSREGTGVVTVLILFIAVQLSGAYIMMGIMVEKGTRIVELLLSSISARNLLIGKVIGIGAVGLIQIGLLVGSFVIAAAVTGSSLPQLGASTLAGGLAFFAVGYLFYGSLYAAGAALAPRQEDAQATLAPVSVLTMLSYLAATVIATNPDNAIGRYAAFVPSVAPFSFPGRIAAGDAEVAEVLVALAITALATGAVFALAGRIYTRSVIHTDRKLGWREAWSLDA